MHKGGFENGMGPKVSGKKVVLVVLGVMMGVTLWVWLLRPSEEGWKVWHRRAATNGVHQIEGGRE